MHQYMLSVHHDDDNAIPEGVDATAVIAEMDGAIASAFVRATKP